MVICVWMSDMGQEAQRMDMSGRGWKDLVQVYREGQRNKFVSFYIEMEEDDCEGTKEKNKANM